MSAQTWSTHCSLFRNWSLHKLFRNTGIIRKMAKLQNLIPITILPYAVALKDVAIWDFNGIPEASTVSIPYGRQMGWLE